MVKKMNMMVLMMLVLETMRTANDVANCYGYDDHLTIDEDGDDDDVYGDVGMMMVIRLALMLVFMIT